MQQKNIALCIILTIVTCGIYGIIWFIAIHNDIDTLSGEADSMSAGLSILLTIVTCGLFGMYWAYKKGETIDKIKMSRGEADGNNKIIYLVLSICGLSIVAWALMQNEINKMIAA